MSLLGSELFQAALRLAGRGWPVMPCKPGDKAPASQNGLLDATTDWEQIIKWWTQVPQCNVGVATGAAAGFVVLDIDGDDGAISLRNLEGEHGALPKTTSVVTPSGGQHYYFKHPGGDFRNSAGRLGQGIDVRGDGGYVLVPPSAIRGVGTYEVDERVKLAPVPEWLHELSQRHLRTDAGPQAPNEWLDMLRGGVAEGGRNHAMARLAGHFLRRYIDLELTREVLGLINRTKFVPPLPDWEVNRTIDSVFDREQQRRAANA